MEQVLSMIEKMKATFSLSYACLAREAGLSYATLMRWKRRLQGGQVLVGKRGPKKVAPLNLSELQNKIQDLDHGNKRSRATGALYRDYGEAVSRRELDGMVREVRSENNRRRRAETYHVTWLRPNLAWAMDDCKKSTGVGDTKLHLHNLTDLASRYRLPPLASHCLPCAEEVAGHLQHLFDRFDPPLFCKRDNHGNLNHTAVDDVLQQALMIPINNPLNQPAYNGGVEHAQGEFKSYLDRWAWKGGSIDQLILLAETAAHDLNHQPRQCLGGITACLAYFGGNRMRYPIRQRQSVYRWVKDLAAEISVRAGNQFITPLAWRVAAKQWLIRNGLIRIEKAGKVSPNFFLELCHN
jgi:hypothetical protein